MKPVDSLLVVVFTISIRIGDYVVVTLRTGYFLDLSLSIDQVQIHTDTNTDTLATCIHNNAL